MEPSGNQLAELVALLNWVYIGTFILLAMLVKKVFGNLLQGITRFKWQPVYTVFALATILAVPWILFTDAGWIEILVSYAIGTSFWEVILEKIVKKVTGK